MNTLDHIAIVVADYARSRAFYLDALAPLGIVLVMEYETAPGHHHAGFGREGMPCFWIGNGRPAASGTHIAFGAASRADVDAFHVAALLAGARDNGAPCLRPQYHPHYYGAFVLDPDGYNVEAVRHAPDPES